MRLQCVCLLTWFSLAPLAFGADEPNAKPPVAKEPAKAAPTDLELLEGEWTHLSSRFDSGQHGMVGSFKWPAGFTTKIRDNHFINGRSGEVVLKFGLNEKAEPKELDAQNLLAAKNEPSIKCGIYKIEGDQLTICWSTAGTKEKPPLRPTKFEVTDANGLANGCSLSVYIKRK